MRPSPFIFPDNFAWGVAMAAAQIEGAAAADGKGESVWDRFARKPGAIANGDTPAIACDHYRRYREDFALMADLGIKHYRLSVAWPRIHPQGDGEICQAGLDFYRRLLDTLHEHGITPWVTLFHWDLPQALEDRGGWPERVVVDAFARYADDVVKALGDRVKRWFTLNEIFCFTRQAYGGGNKAPGLNLGDAAVNQAYHHALLCHGHGVRAVREHGGTGAMVGLAENQTVPIPATEQPADIAAARAWFGEQNWRVLDAIHHGGYAPAYLRSASEAAPRFDAEDFSLISAATDYLGLNIYAGYFVRAGHDGKPERLKFPAHFPAADSPWLQLTPQSLYWGPRFTTEAYGVRSLLIAENGGGYDDDVVVNNECIDLHRRELLRNYLKELHRAIGDGVPVDGYFVWSFLDNFEWQDGYTRRFGLCHVDFETQKRTPKLSAHWYAAVMEANRLV